MSTNSNGAPLVSLCMIVRDEEAALPACLDAARPFVDEIVVVDTGSVDSTKAIAASRGARVLDVPWEDDFAAARNASLEAATGRWIVVLDADEILSPESGAALRRAANQSDVLAAFFALENRYDDAGSSLTALILRAWQNRPQIRFRGRIHEQVLWAVKSLARKERKRMVELPGVVAHDGYRPAIVEARGKNDRNKRIFERAVAELPKDLYLRWKFATFLQRFPNDDARRIALLDLGVRDVAALSRDAVNDLPFAAEFFALRADASRRAGDLEAAQATAARGMKLTQPTPNLIFTEACVALDRRDGAAAEKGFRACMALDGKALVVPGQPGVTNFSSRRGLADALLIQGRAADARVEYEGLIKDAPEARDHFAGWCVAVSHGGASPKEALSYVSARLGCDAKDPAAWSFGGRLLEALGLFDDAATWRIRAAESRRAVSGAKAADATRLAPGFASASVSSMQETLEADAQSDDFAAAAACRFKEGRLEDALALAFDSRSSPLAQAVIAAVSAVADEPAPPCVDAFAPATRAAFKRLVASLPSSGPAAAILAERLRATRDAPTVFDPATTALLAET